MAIVAQIKEAVQQSLQQLYGQAFTDKDFQVNQTKPDFEGDYSVVLFSVSKQVKKAPDLIGQELGQQLLRDHALLFTAFNVIKGFLNLSISKEYWLNFLSSSYNNAQFGYKARNGRKVIVEYSSPNTNKPLHLGHLRNNFLGLSVARLIEANGYDVFKTCIVNDRGVHICKSMWAWKQFGNGATPASTGKKGDHLVGDYYVMFENELKKETEPIIEKVLAGDTSDFSGEVKNKLDLLLQKIEEHKSNKEKISELKAEIKELVRNNSALMAAIRDMLLKWEAGDKEVVDLWKQMNGWVYEGFNATYQRIGSSFEKIYYESETYLLGKEYVQKGLDKGVFFKKADGSVWIDLTADGLDEKLVLRKDGTSVYITQDIGLAEEKFKDFPYEQSIYVIADEQNYHMKVLKLILEKLGLPYAKGVHHLSYGMVELPTGKMKSREGTVVDADDLCDEMIAVAKQQTQERGKTEGFTEEELNELYDTIGIGAMKFYLLRVDPKKRMVFNPEESIDLHGFTAPFIQYTHARIRSVLRKFTAVNSTLTFNSELLKLEKELIVSLERFETTIEQAATEMNPSLIAIYAFQLAQSFNSFYTEHSIANAETAEKKQLRLQIAALTATTLKNAMALLNIKVPERM
jgi:arginyl-tRNA synthetase